MQKIILFLLFGLMIPFSFFSCPLCLSIPKDDSYHAFFEQPASFSDSSVQKETDTSSYLLFLDNESFAQYTDS